MDTKTCTKCGIEKPLNNFSKNPKYRGGHIHQCKKCRYISLVAHRKLIKHDRKQADKKYYENHKENILQQHKVYRKTNPEKCREINRAYYVGHRDKYCEVSHKWYWENREYALDKQRKINRERKRNRHKEKIYRDKNRKRRMEYSRQRRDRVRQNGGNFTQKEWNQLCENHQFKCVKCGRNDLKLTVDHVVPIIRGGNNTIDNIQPLCLKCNLQKQSKVADYRH